jgi:hypothetical protein
MGNPITTDPNRGAQLVDSLYRPVPMTLRDALAHWRQLDPVRQASSYLVINGAEESARHTLNGAQIAMLAAH